jgi:hypothetical protein
VKSFFDILLIVLTIATLILVLVTLPPTLIGTFGLKTKKLMLLIDGFALQFFSLIMLVWWISRHKQTGKRIEALREKIKRMLSKDVGRCEHRRE